jgi:hypothetical protein
VQELLGARTAHQAVVRIHDDVLEAQALEDALVRVAVLLVRDLESRIARVERVRVLHRELAAAQEPGARARFIPVLVLDLVDVQRQVLVRRVEVLHEQGEDLLVRRREQVVGALAVLEPEDAVAVGLPAATGLVRVARQQGGEVHFLRAEGLELLADDPLDLAAHLEAQWQPREDPGSLAADVPGAHEQAMARHLGIDRVLAQGADEELRESSNHEDDPIFRDAAVRARR